jgi:rod shape-determining protein MreD
MTGLVADAAKAGVLLFAAAIVQVSILSTVGVLGGTPDVVLVAVIMIALQRGSAFGAGAGFAAGLIVDTATLGTLGTTSLLLTVAGYWVGRYAETTGRDRSRAPLVSVVVVTLLYAVGELTLHFVLGDAVSARAVLLDALLPSIVFNVLLSFPLHALCRTILPPPERADRAGEVELLG